jgi:hypothetical protein
MGFGFNSRTDLHPVTIPGIPTMVSNNDSVEQKRLAALEEVEELLHDIEQDVTCRIDRIRKNVYIAEDNFLDDGEYNHCVRLALHQMSKLAGKCGAIPSERSERINTLRDGLEEKAALPPHEQITR